MPRTPALEHVVGANSALVAALVVALCATPVALNAQLPRALPNDNRTSAGRMVDGVLHVELEAVITEWRPRGDDGPVLRAAAFAEVGGVPLAPGPMIRVPAGTPVRVTFTNRMDVPFRVAGLGDRGAPATQDAQPGQPDFLRATTMQLEPGQSREVRFTPDEPVTSFYTGRVLANSDEVDGAVFDGVFIVDPANVPVDPAERVFMISASGAEGATPSVKVFMNGLSWPYTERLEYAVGDTVKWRIVNLSGVDHPMHLHGFYFNVDARGDGGSDSTYAGAARPVVVTDMMGAISTLRMSFVPHEPGNWLFHCHLIRHMGEAQLFNVERTRSSAEAHTDHSHQMAGLVLGITVRQAHSPESADPSPTRRIGLWTGRRPGVFDDAPELGFVVQRGAVPAEDSTAVGENTLVLRQGEPTAITVHNRLDFPLAVHWHGLELRSLYDGVGDWSGMPSAVRPPIAPGDSFSVLITPERAGTFMYHTHGEPGYELAQGLYGGFVVQGADEQFEGVRDRLFVMASRGATINAPPAINGAIQPPPERFALGETVRLRFAHISPDEFKQVRLLRNGEPVQWRERAKDGADLPAAQRVEELAAFSLGVGETRDVEWTPTVAGAYVLEVRTVYYPERGGSELQRVVFAVGEVSEEEVDILTRGTALTVVDLDESVLSRYPGVYEMSVQPGFRMSVWMAEGRLFADPWPVGDSIPVARYLVPMNDSTFALGLLVDGAISDASEQRVVRFSRSADGTVAMTLEIDGAPSPALQRLDGSPIDATALARLVGSWEIPGAPIVLQTVVEDGALVLVDPDGTRSRLIPISTTQFRDALGGPASHLEFVIEGDRATALSPRGPGVPPIRFPRKQ